MRNLLEEERRDAAPVANTFKLPGLRWWIVGLVFLATLINYIDRLTISVLAPVITRDLGLTNTEFGGIVTWFLLAYTISQGLSGKLYDRIGTRLGFVVSITIWSVAAIAHAFARGLGTLSLFRFVLGFGEAGNWPGAAKTVAEWFPIHQRAFGMAIFNSGAAIGSIVAPPLIVWLQLKYGWQTTFIVTGVLGFLWLALWLVFYRSPDKHPWITPDELRVIKDTELQRLADAETALAIDDSLAAAHHSIANYKANYLRDNAGAKREFERALELDPNDSSIYADYSQLLVNTGEGEPAIALAQKAKLVDLKDSYASYTLAQAFILSGRYDEGLQETQTTISLDDRNWWGYYWRAVAYSQKGMSDEAISAGQTAAKLDDSPLIRGVLACLLARAGRRAEAQRVIDDLIIVSKSKFVSQASIAMGYAGMGETEKAFEWLNLSLRSHDEQIIWIYKHPMFASLRNDPRYGELLKELNLR